MTNSFIKQSIYYLAYGLLTILIYLILISLVAFFHFLLDHQVSIIEEWIFENGHQMIIVAKAIALCLTLSVVNIYYQEQTLVKYIFKNNWIPLPHQIYVVTAVQLLLSLVLGEITVKVDSTPDFFKIIVSFTSTILFYLLDIFLLVALEQIAPLKEKWSLWASGLFAMIFFLVTKCIFLYGPTVGWPTVLVAFFCFYLTLWREKSWSFPFFYLLFSFAPLSALGGMDILWGETYALFLMGNKVGEIFLPVGIGVSLVYLLWARKKI